MENLSSKHSKIKLRAALGTMAHPVCCCSYSVKKNTLLVLFTGVAMENCTPIISAGSPQFPNATSLLLVSEYIAALFATALFSRLVVLGVVYVFFACAHIYTSLYPCASNHCSADFRPRFILLII